MSYPINLRRRDKTLCKVVVEYLQPFEKCDTFILYRDQ